MNYLFSLDYIPRIRLRSVFLLSLGCFANQALSQEVAPKVDYKAWLTYAENIRNCSLGQFTLPDPVKIGKIRARYKNIAVITPEEEMKLKQEIEDALISYQIFGWDKDKCVVTISEPKDLNPPPTTTPITSSPPGVPTTQSTKGALPEDQECRFSKEDLIFLEETAKKVGGEHFLLFTEDPDASIKGQACKQKVPPLPPLTKPFSEAS